MISSSNVLLKIIIQEQYKHNTGMSVWHFTILLRHESEYALGSTNKVATISTVTVTEGKGDQVDTVHSYLLLHVGITVLIIKWYCCPNKLQNEMRKKNRRRSSPQQLFLVSYKEIWSTF